MLPRWRSLVRRRRSPGPRADCDVPGVEGSSSWLLPRVGVRGIGALESVGSEGVAPRLEVESAEGGGAASLGSTGVDVCLLMEGLGEEEARSEGWDQGFWIRESRASEVYVRRGGVEGSGVVSLIVGVDGRLSSW